ncbi:MAG: undecaprenyl-phosphate glucose phosphotransferase [Deltaproteobacteria bacterium]|nr:undecaprenyl-phosphate glucose phosphotransferase [Deltaproteobacteria bacterium]
MVKEKRSLFEFIFLIFDLCVVTLAWLFAYWFRFFSGLFSVSKGIPDPSLYLNHILLVCVVWGLAYRNFGLYHSQRFTSLPKLFWNILKANTAGIFVLLALTYLGWGKNDPFSRLAFGWFWFFATAFSFLGRLGVRILMKELRRHGFNVKYLLLVGESQASVQFLQRLEQARDLGFEVVGILVTEKYNRQDFYGVKVLGTLKDLMHVVSAFRIDTVVFALPLHEMNNIEDLIEILSTTHVDVKIIPDVSNLLTVGGSIEELDGIPIISIQENPIQGIDFALKRLFDVTVASVALIALFPAFVVIAIIIKLTSKGPVFYHQERVTLDGVRFKIYKFRTMRVDAEKDKPVWSGKNDPRVTKFGKFLRRWSLDELPQLWNVLKGDMSLVGPRPERPYFIKTFRQKFPSYMLRHKVPAGLTGLAQLHGLRGDTSIEERLKYDLLYMKNWSIFLDIKIIVLTLLKGLKNKEV